MRPIPVVKYSEFYSLPLPDDHFAFLRGYPTDFLVLHLSKVNAIIYNANGESSASQQAILDECFEDISTLKRAKIMAYLEDSAKEVAFFTSPGIVRLINACLQNFCPLPLEDMPVDMQSLMEDLFDSILIQNELYYSSIADSIDLQSYEAIWSIQLMQQHYIRSHSRLFNIAPLKSFLLYKYLTAVLPGGSKYVKEFAENLQIGGYFNFLMIFMESVRKVIDCFTKKETRYILTLVPERRKLIEEFSITKKDLVNGTYAGNVHKDLIPHPFYFIDSEHPVIVDFHFLNHIVDVALPFSLYRYSSLNASAEFPNYVSFKAELGKSYYEDFLLRSLFKKIFEKEKFSLFTDTELASGSDFTIVKNQSDILMVEVKSSEIHFNPLEQINIDEFKLYLNKQFCSKKIGAKTRNKGVFQLIRQIEDFAINENSITVIKNWNARFKTKIYPVIIYTEGAMDIDGVGSYLNEYFEAHIADMRKQFKKIYPVTAINLNFFISYYIQLRENPNVLFELIKSYWESVAGRAKKHRRDKNPVTYWKMHVSFEHYVANKLKYRSENFQAIIKDLELLKS